MKSDVSRTRNTADTMSGNDNETMTKQTEVTYRIAMTSLGPRELVKKIMHLLHFLAELRDHRYRTLQMLTK